MKTIAGIIVIFCLTITVRLLVFEIYSIPSGSMEETLQPGDKVLVNKLVYGAKLPASPYDIPWVNLFRYLRSNTSSITDSVFWPYSRLKGFFTIKEGP